MARIWFLSIIFTVLFINISPNNTLGQIPGFDMIKTSKDVPDSIEVNQIIEISNVNKEIEYTDNLILKVHYSKDLDSKQKELLHIIDTFNIYVTQQGAEFREFSLSDLSHYFLKNARFTWQEYYNNLRIHQGYIQKLIRENQRYQNSFIVNKVKWQNSLPTLRKDLSGNMLSHINGNIAKINKVIKIYDSQLQDLIASENDIVEDIIFVDNILNDIDYFIERRREELFVKNEEGLFDAEYKNSYEGSFFDRIKLALYENTKTISYSLNYVRNNFVTYMVVLLLGLLYVFFIRKKYLGLNYDDNVSGYKKVSRIIAKRPFILAFAVALILWLVLIPYSPLFIVRIIFLALLISLLFVLTDLLDKYTKNVAIIISVLLAFNNLELFGWYFGNYSRFYLLFETILGLALTVSFILPKYRRESLLKKSIKLVYYTRLLSPMVFILFFIAFWANILGFVNLAVYSIKLAVHLGTITIIIFGFLRISESILQASVDVLNIYFPNIVEQYGNNIIKTMYKYIRFFLFISWGLLVLFIAEVFSLFNAGVIKFLTQNINIGSLSFSLLSLFIFLGVLYFTYAITRFTKVIIEREVLSKYKLKRGIAASISLTIRIFVFTFGTIIAFSATGMDLSKIGFIAGALSVGIGFGLQNVVNNFISGLILIYEKPLQEGDTVEVGNLLGRVSNIGIRASNVITYDGAEVVVPNSNLISNQLINWTLSDNKKRIEVKVGAAYGSNPNEILKLLTKVVLEHPKVLPMPAPLPLFEGFGDSSLDFKVLFWVHFQDGFKTHSDVAIAIYNTFKENNIQIPFPQMDLYVKEIPKLDQNLEKSE